MFTVSALAKQSKVTADTVRYYVKLGLLSPDHHPRNNYKIFTQEDVHKIKMIKNAQSLGFSLKEISRMFSSYENSENQMEYLLGILKQRVAENQKRIDSLLRLQKRMERALKACAQLPNALSVEVMISQLADIMDEEGEK